MKSILGLILILIAVVIAYAMGFRRGELHGLMWIENELDKIFNKDEKRNDCEDESM